jgi:hypothetical protein
MGYLSTISIGKTEIEDKQEEKAEKKMISD